MIVKKVDEGLYHINGYAYFQIEEIEWHKPNTRVAEFGFYGKYPTGGEYIPSFNDENINDVDMFIDSVRWCANQYYQWVDHGVLPEESKE